MKLKISLKLLLAVAAVVLCIGKSVAQQNSNLTNIVVSIKPFYNITAAITKGVVEPQLLVSDNQSVHDFTLRPSDLILLSKANLVIYYGNELEGFLNKPLSNTEAEQLEIERFPNLLKLNNRDFDDDQHHEHGHHNHNHHQHKHHHNGCCNHHHGQIDPHIWLSPANAKIIATNICQKLIQLDPNNQDIYQQNLQIFLSKVKNNLESLPKISPANFFVFHDAYQYFENFYKFKTTGIITINPEVPISAKRLAALQQKINQDNVKCLFKEPQFSPKLVETLQESNNLAVFTLDPLGQNDDLGPDGYFRLIEKIHAGFSLCK